MLSPHWWRLSFDAVLSRAGLCCAVPIAARLLSEALHSHTAGILRWQPLRGGEWHKWHIGVRSEQRGVLRCRGRNVRELLGSTG